MFEKLVSNTKKKFFFSNSVFFPFKTGLQIIQTASINIKIRENAER